MVRRPSGRRRRHDEAEATEVELIDEDVDQSGSVIQSYWASRSQQIVSTVSWRTAILSLSHASSSALIL